MITSRDVAEKLLWNRGGGIALGGFAIVAPGSLSNDLDQLLSDASHPFRFPVYDWTGEAFAKIVACCPAAAKWFPAVTIPAAIATAGRFCAKSSFAAAVGLNKPVEDIAERMHLGYAFTQRGMRRTFNDLARRANSTVDPAEQRDCIAKVIDLFAARPASGRSEASTTGAEGSAATGKAGRDLP